METIGELKRRLTELGISTSTPGIFGDDRLEELKLRLELHNKRSVQGPSQSIDQRKIKTDDMNSNPSKTLSTLSMAELRNRLTALGENTATPGLVGDERRLELIRRLTVGICGVAEDESSPKKQVRQQIR